MNAFTKKSVENFDNKSLVKGKINVGVNFRATDFTKLIYGKTQWDSGGKYNNLGIIEVKIYLILAELVENTNFLSGPELSYCT